MILGRKRIIKEVATGNIVIKPFNHEMVNPNSIDVRLQDTIYLMDVNSNGYNDPRIEPVAKMYTIPKSGFVINPRELVIGATVEVAGSTKYVPMYDGRSTLGRWGVFSHITAGFGDVGFIGTWTLEIKCVKPFLLLPGMRIGQVFFYTVDGIDLLYNGNYQGQTGPRLPKPGNI